MLRRSKVALKSTIMHEMSPLKKKLNLFYTVIWPPAVPSKILTSSCAK